MDFTSALKEYLINNGKESYVISDVRWNPDGSGIFYVEMQEPDLGKFPVRCRVKKESESYRINSFSPMKRFNENSHSPWDTTIKDTKNLFSAFPGIGGVANRTVNRSLI